MEQEEKAVGKAAIGNLLGGIGYFYGQSKIAIPEGLAVSFFTLMYVWNCGSIINYYV
jgi:mannosyl-oligosaccharide glucosidase